MNLKLITVFSVLIFFTIINFSCGVKKPIKINLTVENCDSNVNYVKKYFEKFQWQYPLQIDSNIMVDSIPKNCRFNDNIELSNKAYLELGMRLTHSQDVAYKFSNAKIYKKGKNYFFSVGIEKFLNNRKCNIIPMEDAGFIDSFRIFVFANRATFSLNKDSLIFIKWED